ncbi:hypothetical protein SAMN06295933_1519 [Desulfovibrio gilichinskyi]|uniref:Uncharacterized protein n=1 Tax=Desulfovibrio gilichinskyi TaxID=1519643 RepID=A0A1X7D175_9BACT|nr:hypothetical protein SAMN06295933_1519 [Desulfovibrio gilichinskyi]
MLTINIFTLLNFVAVTYLFINFNNKSFEKIFINVDRNSDVELKY